VGSEVWLYDGERSRPIAALSGKAPRQVIGGAAVEGHTVYGLFGGTAIVAFDSQTGRSELVDLPRSPGHTPGRFLVVDRDGNRYLAYPDAPEVRRIAPDGTSSTFIGGSKAAPQIWVPADVALDRENAVFILDTANHSLLKFQPDGTFSARCDLGKYRLGWLNRMRIDGANRLYLLTNNNQRKSIVRFDLTELFPKGDREGTTSRAHVCS